MSLERPGPIATWPLRLVERSDPSPGSAEILVRVRVCRVCRTDLHIIEGDLPPHRLPLVPGHQAVGVVEAVGRDCRRLARGERVGIPWLRGTCGGCPACRDGRENLCPGSVYSGYDEDGGYAELALVSEAYAYRIPPVFADREAAPLLCAGIIGYRALERCRLPAGGRLGLYGFGSSAHVVLQIARHRGAEVFVATRGEEHRALARRLGAAWTAGVTDPMPGLLDSAIVFAPVGEIVPAALRAVRPGGTVALAGIHMTPIPPLDYTECLFHEKTLTSVAANTRDDGEALLREAAAVPVRPEATVFLLEAANEALAELRDGRLSGSGVLLVDPRAD